jgi:anaerobic magnesium-protoporphyrin IX monomethyl ester cyclase
MDLMFTNTFPATYYKQLHRYVHQNYHKHLAKNSLVKLIKNPLGINVGNLKKALSVFYYMPATYVERLRLNHLEKA